MRIILLFCTLFLMGSLAFGQENPPLDYFSNPLKIPLLLSGNFGELRTNHFHSGLDIKTQQREGIPIYATADGYVSRINVAHYGFGKALYIQHPNGYSTVYAHLQKFAGDIEAHVKEIQYSRELFEVELYPKATILPVRKGDLIGYTGNTGSSGGPHLHFEIRDENSRPMNPLLFGIDIGDSKKPLVNSIIAYPLSNDAHINGIQNPVKLKLIPLADGSYKTDNIVAFGRIGFGISTDDQQDGASNKNGVFQIKSSYNGSEKFAVQFDKFSFDETRYLNRYIDYRYFMENKSRVQKLFRQSNNPLSVIKNSSDDGTITMDDGYNAIYTVEIKDFKDNLAFISIPIEGKNIEILETISIEETNDYIYSDQGTSISKGKYSIYIPANSLYENTFLDIEVNGDTLKFHKDVIPIHKNISITVDASNYNAADLDKLYIGRLNYRGKPYYNSTSRKEGKLTTNIRTFGTYLLTSDFKNPTVKAVNFQDGQWISKNSILQVRIEDDLSGIGTYHATINGKFILMEYNYKKDVLTYSFDDNIITESENNLKVIVVDNVGNSTTFEATFFRK